MLPAPSSANVQARAAETMPQLHLVSAHSVLVHLAPVHLVPNRLILPFVQVRKRSCWCDRLQTGFCGGTVLHGYATCLVLYNGTSRSGLPQTENERSACPQCDICLGLCWLPHGLHALLGDSCAPIRSNLGLQRPTRHPYVSCSSSVTPSSDILPVLLRCCTKVDNICAGKVLAE